MAKKEKQTRNVVIKIIIKQAVKILNNNLLARNTKIKTTRFRKFCPRQRLIRRELIVIDYVAFVNYQTNAAAMTR